MINAKTVDGVHRPESVANKYTSEELILMKTQDIGYVLQKVQSEKKKTEKLTAMLHSLNDQPSKGHMYYAGDRDEAKERQLQASNSGKTLSFEELPKHIRRKTAASYRELVARKSRVKELKKLYMHMSMTNELQKKGRKRKLGEDEIICPTSKPVYKLRAERKR